MMELISPEEFQMLTPEKRDRFKKELALPEILKILTPEEINTLRYEMLKIGIPKADIETIEQWNRAQIRATRGFEENNTSLHLSGSPEKYKRIYTTILGCRDAQARNRLYRSIPCRPSP